MLQWMGGSRRKVTASRKSTQRRQKQYFEQRRRQQQHQQEAAYDGENYVEGNRTQGWQSQNNRSLDILSLLNVSAIAQEHKSDCPKAREKSEDDALNYPTLQHLPIVQSNDIKTQEQTEIEEARISSRYQMGIACQKMISTSSPGNHAASLKTVDEKMNQSKLAPDCQLSVFDIIEDDEPNNGCKNSLAHEAHVAFSIEGLGMVETETPAHSPEGYRRTFLQGCPSPSKATNIVNPSKDLIRKMVNLEPELDAMWEIGSPFCRSSVDEPFCSKENLDSFSKHKGKLDFEEFSLFNDCNDSLHDHLGDDELFYGSKDSKESIWNSSSILVDDILHETGFHLTDKNWKDPLYTPADLLNCMDFRKEYFEGLDQQENRTTMRREGRIGCTESPLPNFNCWKSENIPNFTPVDRTWHTSIGRDLGDLKDEFGESCFITDDAAESLSLPSEESCSSTAERGKRSLLNLEELVMRDRDDIFHSEGFCSEKDASPRERNCSIKQQMYVPGKFTTIPNPSRLTQAPQLHTNSNKKLKQDHSRCFEPEHDLGLQNSCCNSFSETSETIKHAPSGCRLWSEDVFHTVGDTKLESNSPCLERLSKSSAKCSLGCNITSGRPDFCQPNMQNMSGSCIQYTSQASAGRDKSPKPLDVDGCLTPKRENIAGLADGASGVQESDPGNFQPQKGELSGSKSLSSESGKLTGAPDSHIEYKDCKESTCKTLNMEESQNKMSYFHHAEGMPSFETSSIFKDEQCNVDMKRRFAPTSHLCRTGFGEIEDTQPKQKTMGSDSPSTANSACQVTMLDSYVLHLLCVQVLKKYPQS